MNASIKNDTEKKKYQSALSLIEDENTKGLHTVDLTRAIRIRFEVDETIASNFWRKTGVINSSVTHYLQRKEEKEAGIEIFNVE